MNDDSSDASPAVASSTDASDLPPVSPGEVTSVWVTSARGASGGGGAAASTEDPASVSLHVLVPSMHTV